MQVSASQNYMDFSALPSHFYIGIRPVPHKSLLFHRIHLYGTPILCYDEI